MKKLHVGEKFGKLTVLRVVSNHPNWKHKYVWYECLCECGKRLVTAGSRLRSGEQKSCSCSRGNIKHGFAKTMPLFYQMWLTAKRRATLYKLSFSITPTDIKIPKRCPLLGIRLKHTNRTHDASPSLDRLNNMKGYTPKNIIVISYKANRAKSNLTLSELQRLVQNLRRISRGSNGRR